MKLTKVKVGDIITTYRKEYIETDKCKFKSDSFFKITEISGDNCTLLFIPWLISYIRTDIVTNVPLNFIRLARKKDAKHHVYKQFNLPEKKIKKTTNKGDGK